MICLTEKGSFNPGRMIMFVCVIEKILGKVLVVQDIFEDFLFQSNSVILACFYKIKF